VPDSAPTSSLAAGSFSFAAAYSGDSNYAASSSSCQAFRVASTSSAISAVVDDVATSQAWSGGEAAGAAAFDAATVTGAGGVAPTGTVTYGLFAGGACAGTPAMTAQATLADGKVPQSRATGALAPGDYSFGAAYSGDSSYGASTSSCQRFNVLAAPPSVVLSLRAAGVELYKGQVKHIHYLCADTGGPGIASCKGTVADGAQVDTAKTGRHTVTVTATSADGQTTTHTVVYIVVPDNYFPVTHLKVHPNPELGGASGDSDQDGIVAVQLRLPGPGTISVQETALGELTGVAPAGAARPMVYASARVQAAGARTMLISLAPNAAGKLLIQEHPYVLWVEIAITYTPTGGSPFMHRYRVNVSNEPSEAG
jgi:hypothetical protein